MLTQGIFFCKIHVLFVNLGDCVLRQVHGDKCDCFQWPCLLIQTPSRGNWWHRDSHEKWLGSIWKAIRL